MVMVCLASKDILSLSLLPWVDTTKRTSSDFSVGMSGWMKSVEKSSLTTMMILSSLQIRRLEFRNSKQKQLVTLKNLFRSAIHWALHSSSNWRKKWEKRCTYEKCRWFAQLYTLGYCQNNCRTSSKHGTWIEKQLQHNRVIMFVRCLQYTGTVHPEVLAF